MVQTTTQQQRKAQALETAALCMRILKERFGARRTILFGSLRGDTPWHNHADIDLAVEGLPPDDFFNTGGLSDDQHRGVHTLMTTPHNVPTFRRYNVPTLNHRATTRGRVRYERR